MAGDEIMEWIFGIVLAVMLGLLCYTVFWTSVAVNKKGQPVVDSLFQALHYFLRAKAPTPEDDSGTLANQNQVETLRVRLLKADRE
jgi:hypothetical protein